MSQKPSVLFLCTGNACRSHMGEALMRGLAADRFEVCSAGSRPAGFVHPLAIAAMEEIGISLSGHRSKGLDHFGDRIFDYVITVCDSAATACPNLRGRLETLRWPMEDPAAIPGDVDAALLKAGQVRAALKQKIEAFLLAHP